MPPNVPSIFPTRTMSFTVAFLQNSICNVSTYDINSSTIAQVKWLITSLGQEIASHYEVPVEFFNMTLVNAPIVYQGIDPPAIPVSYTIANTATILASMSDIQPAPTSTVSVQSQLSSIISRISLSASSSKTSSSLLSQSTTLSSSSGIHLKPTVSSASQVTLHTSSSHSSTSKTATPTPSQTPGSAFPITPQMQACECK